MYRWTILDICIKVTVRKAYLHLPRGIRHCNTLGAVQRTAAGAGAQVSGQAADECTGVTLRRTTTVGHAVLHSSGYYPKKNSRLITEKCWWDNIMYNNNCLMFLIISFLFDSLCLIQTHKISLNMQQSFTKTCLLNNLLVLHSTFEKF